MMCLEDTWYVAAFGSTPMHDPELKEVRRPARVCVCKGASVLPCLLSCPQATRRAANTFLCHPQRRSAFRLSYLPPTAPCPAMMKLRAFRCRCQCSRLLPHRSTPRALSAPPMWRSSQLSHAQPRAAERRWPHARCPSHSAPSRCHLAALGCPSCRSLASAPPACDCAWAPEEKPPPVCIFPQRAQPLPSRSAGLTIMPPRCL